MFLKKKIVLVFVAKWRKQIAHENFVSISWISALQDFQARNSIDNALLQDGSSVPKYIMLSTTKQNLVFTFNNDTFMVRRKSSAFPTYFHWLPGFVNTMCSPHCGRKKGQESRYLLPIWHFLWFCFLVAKAI